jgi:hypothetical protein
MKFILSIKRLDVLHQTFLKKEKQLLHKYKMQYQNVANFIILLNKKV